MCTALTRRFASYDDILGPRGMRYFGDGYRHVGHHLSDVSAAGSLTDDCDYTAVAKLTYPSGWSTKSCPTLVPHLSSIDTIVLAATMCERVLIRTHSLSDQEASRMWVRHVTVRAGMKPELDLTSVPVRAIASRPPGGTSADDERETTFRFEVGALAGVIVVRHTARPSPDRASSPPPIAVPSPASSRRHFYLDGVKDQTLSASDIVLDDACEHITARHEISTTCSAGTEYTGADAAYAGSTSIVQGVIGAAQLAQTLLYQLDSVDRRESNTLWMKRIELDADRADRPCSPPFPVAAELRRKSLIEHAGGQWRRASIAITEFNGLTGSCDLVHRLAS